MPSYCDRRKYVPPHGGWTESSVLTPVTFGGPHTSAYVRYRRRPAPSASRLSGVGRYRRGMAKNDAIDGCWGAQNVRDRVIRLLKTSGFGRILDWRGPWPSAIRGGRSWRSRS